MRGSIAENQGRYSGYNQKDKPRRRGGYSLRPSSERGDTHASVVQVQLGRLQVAVWIGLALSAVAVSYVVGFYSGRHVGFKVARDTSATNLAKLSVPQVLSVNVPKNSAKIYEKLNRPAVIQKNSEEMHNKRGSLVIPRVNETAREESNTVAMRGDAVSTEVLEDDLFTDLTSGGELIIGDESSMKKILRDKRPPKREVKKTEKKVAKAAKLVGSDAKFARSIPAGFYAQVAAPKRLQDAEKLARRLKQSGFPVAIESVTIDRQSFYRVLVGPEQNKLYTERLIGQLHSERYIPTDPFIREVR